ncbi:MAG: cell division protein FtsZ [Bacteroidetes bacterium]|nr:MAG: cell division protein FtsZ [Bacteroidota bacterium]
MEFALPKSSNNPIKVIGVGGGGSNAVNTMFEQGIKGVDFIVCNTDAQALDVSPVPLKVQLGSTLTAGQGAGSIPEVGMNAAIENLEDLTNLLGADTKMVFVTAGMGGGTGTGAGPVIAKACRDLGILTVGIVTIPFKFEGKKRSTQADSGLKNMRDAVDTLLVIRNDKLRELYGNQTLRKAFKNADQVLCIAAKGIAEVITRIGEINVDMNDVNTVMRQSGNAIMGSGMASGEGRSKKAVITALESPLLNDNDITGAKHVLLNITVGSEDILMDEIMEITDYIQDAAGQNAEVIWGYALDEELEEEICITVIATGFEAHEVQTGSEPVEKKVITYDLGDESQEITTPVNRAINPTNTSEEQIENKEVGNDEPYIVSSSEQDYSDLFNTSPETAEPEALKDNAEGEIVIHNLDDAPLDTTPTNSFSSPSNNDAFLNLDIENKNKNAFAERQRQTKRALNDVNMKLMLPGRISDYENEPAYKRRDIILDEVTHSSKSSVSRFSINEEIDENGERRIELRDNNPFLHDNVD